MRSLLTKVFGDPNEAPVKRFQGVIPEVNALEPEMAALSDEGLAALASEFRLRLDRGESLDDLLPE